MDNLQIRYFLSAVEIGNFTIAALDNNISQSSFSKRIMALEKELGVELFIRGKRSLDLTPAGQHFLRYARQYETDYYTMQSGLRHYMFPYAGTVRVSSIPVVHPYKLARLFSTFRAAHPDTPVDLLELSESTFVYEALRRGESDFAIVRTDLLDREQFDEIPLVQDELIILAPRTHPIARYDAISCAQLRGEKMSFPIKGTDFYHLCETACQKGGFSPEPYYTVSGLRAMYDMIQHDGILAFDMLKIAESTPLGGLKIIRLSERITSTVALIRYRSRMLDQSMQQFWQYVRENAAYTPE